MVIAAVRRGRCSRPCGASTADGLRKRLHRYSEDNRFALELRISLIVLFTLGALAVATHVSIMLAGFALGLVITAAGEPRRLARQLFGITEGLFGPLFFVWLGASLQVRELGDRTRRTSCWVSAWASAPCSPTAWAG